MKNESSKNIIPSIVKYEEKSNNVNVNEGIEIINDGDNIKIIVNKKFLLSKSTFDIQQLLMLSLSTLFLNNNKQIISDDSQSIEQIKNHNKKSFPHIVFFIENMEHYTGGRYSLFHQAVLLSQYTKVTVITNRKPIFYNDFKDYYNDRFKMIVDESYLGKSVNSNYDIVVGVPMLSGEYATAYAERNKLPLYLVMFESPNWISKFREGADSFEEFWHSYKKCLIKADKIIVPSHESKKYVAEWIDKSLNIDVVYPCINELVAKQYSPKTLMSKGEKNIVISTRMSPFKSPLAIMKRLGNKYKYHIIGKVWKDSIEQIKKLNLDVIFYGKCSDIKKFKIISECDLLIHPSLFEGFGMPPMEAIYYDKPVVVFDLPVLREIYGNSITYAKWDDYGDFVKKIKSIFNKEEIDNPDDVLKVKNQLQIKYCLEQLMDVFGIPKITAGIIVYNGSEYLEYAINSIKHLLFQIVIIEGAVKGYSNKLNSDDSTIKIINKIKKEDGVFRRIEINSTKKFWEDKIEMQNEIAKRIEGEFYLKLDSDEIWNPETLMDVINIMVNDPKIIIVKMPFLHFWLNFNTVAKDAGGKWSGSKHPRIWRWRKEYRHYKSFNYFVNMKKGFRKICAPYVNEFEYKEDVIYHFGYVRKLKYLLEKINYYKNRGIESFVEDTVTNWKHLSDRTQPTQNPSRVKSWAEKFDGQLPKILDGHLYKNIKDVRELE